MNIYGLLLFNVVSLVLVSYLLIEIADTYTTLKKEYWNYHIDIMRILFIIISWISFDSFFLALLKY